MHPFYPRAGVTWDDNEVDELLHWIQNGMSTYDFSLARGRSHSSVILRFALCYDEGLIEIICHRELHPNRFQYNIDDIKWTDMEKDALIDELIKHLPINDIADIHHRSPRAIKFTLSTFVDRHIVEIQICNGGDE